MINIAIDGFSGCGKSTLAKLLVKRLGESFKILDTGAIFRGFAYVYDKSNLGDMTEKKIEKFLKDTSLEVVFKEDGQHVVVNGEDVNSKIRTEKISQLASKISTFANIRERYQLIAKKFAAEYNCVMEGRDIATVIMPNADVKIFLTADKEIRAERRFEELKSKDIETTFEDVLQDLEIRDERDSTRENDPLMPTNESVIVDNSDMTIEETVEHCLNLINEKINLKKAINIAIDGYVCSGKSTIAKALAKRLGFKVFDTGAVYRGIACAYDYMKYDQECICEDCVNAFARQINVSVEFIEGVQHVFVNGIDYTMFLRTEKTSSLTAKISPFTSIRKKVLNLQREFAKRNNLVMEGRDIGSYVLPDAEFKFFCTADEIVRAKRRYEQQKALGNDVEYEDVLRELQQRDYNDTHRDHGAIKKLSESIVIDTTNQGLEESVEFCLKEMRKKYPEL